MTTAILVRDPLDTIKDLERRIYVIEQGRGGSDYTSGGANIFPNGIQIGNASPIFVDEDVPAPTGLSLSWGSYFDVIFIDASWNAPTGSGADQVRSYELEVTKVGFGVATSRVTQATNAHVEPLEPNTQYSLRVRSINRLGQSSAYTAPVTITTGTDSSLPGQVTGVILSAGFKSVVIRWTENTEADMKNGKGLYEVQIATDTLFTQNLRTVRVSATITSFSDLTTGVTYYTRVRAIDSSGNFGAFSSTASGTTGQTQSGDYGNLTIDDAAIANLSADKVTFGTMHGDRIQVNTLNANRMTTSELNAAIVTITSGGMIRTGRTTAPFHYSNWDENSFRMYKDGTSAFAGGTLTVEINTATGNTLFKGNIDAQSGTISGSITIGGKLRALADGTNYVEFGTNVGSGGTYYGLSLSQSNLNNGFVRRNDGVILFRVNSGGSSYITYDSSSGALTVRGLFRTADSGLRIEVSSTGTYANQVAFFSGQGGETSPGGAYSSGKQLWFIAPRFSDNAPFIILDNNIPRLTLDADGGLIYCQDTVDCSQGAIQMGLSVIWLNGVGGSTSVYDLTGFGSVVASGGDAFIGGSGSNSSARMTGGRVKARNYGDTAFVDFEGANIAPSDSKIKKAIRATTRTELFSAFGKTKTKRYRRITDPDTHPLRYGLIAEELDPDLQRPIVNRPMTQVAVPREEGKGTYMKAEYGPEERLTGYNVDEVLAMVHGVVEFLRQDTVENRAKINEVIAALPIGIGRPVPLQVP